MVKGKTGLYCYLPVDILIKVLQKCFLFFCCCHGNWKTKMLTYRFYSCLLRWANVAHRPMVCGCLHFQMLQCWPFNCTDLLSQGSVYQKTQAAKEINLKERDKFWSKTEVSIISSGAWQNQQNDLCTQRRLRLAWASSKSDQSSLSAWRRFGSSATHKEHSEDTDQTG